MQGWKVQLPDWFAMRTTAVLEALAGIENPERPWDAQDPDLDADVVAEAEAYLIAHSAMRDM